MIKIKNFKLPDNWTNNTFIEETWVIMHNFDQISKKGGRTIKKEDANMHAWQEITKKDRSDSDKKIAIKQFHWWKFQNAEQCAQVRFWVLIIGLSKSPNFNMELSFKELKDEENCYP